MILRIGFFCLCLCFALPALAEDYIAPTWPDLLHTMIRFNALDLMQDDKLLDEYAAITECDLYQYYYKDDFKWNQVRGTIRKSIELNKSTYPSRYYFGIKLRLDRYDFATKLYGLSEENAINSISSILIFKFGGAMCGEMMAKYLPAQFRVTLNPKVSIEGLPLESKTAEALMKYMDATDNEQHYVYARFNMTVTYIKPFRKAAADPGAPDNLAYYQLPTDRYTIHFEVRADSVDFYKDPEMTQLIYTYKPPPPPPSTQ